MNRLYALLPLILVLAFPVLAFAQGADAGPATPSPDEPAVTTAALSIMELAFYAIGLIGAALLVKLVATIEKRFKVKVPASMTEKANVLFDKAIHYAEEQARKKVKAGLSKASLPSKLEIAADFALQLAEDHKLKELGKEKIKQLIEARLGEHRAVETNATTFATLKNH